jgi:hypothetical protein
MLNLFCLLRSPSDFASHSHEPNESCGKNQLTEPKIGSKERKDATVHLVRKSSPSSSSSSTFEDEEI